jgi:hypothetical protein
MVLVTRKSECKHPADQGMLIKSPKEITRHNHKEAATKYCIIVKPFHDSFLPYKQIVFRGVTFSDDFSIELIRNNEPVVIDRHYDEAELAEHIFHSNGDATFRLMH